MKSRIIERRMLHRGWATLERRVLDVDKFDGGSATLIREVFTSGDAAAVLPFDRERGTVLLINQYCAGADAWVLTVCAGKLDLDAPEAAAIREAEEELGYRIGNCAHVTTAYVSPGANTERIALFLATYGAADKVSDGGGVATEHEDIEVVEMTFAEALGKVRSGKICDLKTIVLLQHLAALERGEDVRR
ncbi:NUDIX domain-containing protein [Aminobacter sp. Piv2-1]|uniref:NUDIX domain-containing protein n=1 Tax=Aminobacter sp. Piv2-1 TaxID=3031122 RepID=UPI0030AB800A